MSLIEIHPARRIAWQRTTLMSQQDLGVLINHPFFVRRGVRGKTTDPEAIMLFEFYDEPFHLHTQFLVNCGVSGRETDILEVSS